jgi:hypothetical protein
MIDLVPLATAAASGGGVTLLGQWASDWIKSRQTSSQHEMSLDAQLEQHRDNITFDLLKAAKEEITSLREEVIQLRPLSPRVAHLEEALEHIDSMLNASNDIERELAGKRAEAFLKRMRPNGVSVRNLATDADGKL